MNWINQIVKNVVLDSQNGRLVKTFATTLAIILFGISIFIYFNDNTLETPIVILVLSLFVYYSKCTFYMRYVYIVWLVISKSIGTILSTILLSLLYVCIVTPIGILKRTFGKQGMKGWNKIESSEIEFDKLY